VSAANGRNPFCSTTVLLDPVNPVMVQYSSLIAIRINPKYRSFNYKFYSAFYSRRITN
jgi:hypothetical protein